MKRLFILLLFFCLMVAVPLANADVVSDTVLSLWGF